MKDKELLKRLYNISINIELFPYGVRHFEKNFVQPWKPWSLLNCGNLLIVAASQRQRQQVVF